MEHASFTRFTYLPAYDDAFAFGVASSSSVLLWVPQAGGLQVTSLAHDVPLAVLFAQDRLALLLCSLTRCFICNTDSGGGAAVVPAGALDL